MQIDDIKNSCDNGSEIIGYGARLNFFKILESDIPVALLALGPQAVIVLVAQDGSVCLTEMGVPSKDFDHIKLPLDDILARVCGAEFSLDLDGSGILKRLNGLPLVTAIKGRPTICGLSNGAKQSLGYARDISIDEIHKDLKELHDGTSIFEHLTSAGKTLDDPLFMPDNQQSWTGEDIELLRPIFQDALTIHPMAGEGYFTLKGASDGVGAFVTDEMDRELSDPIIDILRELVDFDTRFKGEHYEYNDGIASRASGYYPDAPEIISVEMQATPSSHEKLIAWSRLNHLLIEVNVPSQTIMDLIGKEKEL